MPVFLDDDDYSIFLNHIKTLLAPTTEKDRWGRLAPNYYNQIELLTYALMHNHFHLLIYQVGERDIVNFMHSLMTRYSKYFNKKYKRVGPVFQSRYSAKLIMDDAHLYHISRYIHLNPNNWIDSPYTSIDFYSGKRHANWVQPGKILDLFPSTAAYLEFLKDYNPSEDEQYADIEPDD